MKKKREQNNDLSLLKKAQLSSYILSEYIVKNNYPHVIGEKLLKPCIVETVNLFFGSDLSNQIRRIPLSDNIVCDRSVKMGENILINLIFKLKNSKMYSIQLDESVDTFGKNQFICFNRYHNTKNIKSEFLFCRELKKTSRGIDIFNILDKFFIDNDLDMQRIISVCTDGAPAMTGEGIGFWGYLKRKIPSLVTVHCKIHKMVLASKNLGDVFENVFKIMFE